MTATFNNEHVYLRLNTHEHILISIGVGSWPHVATRVLQLIRTAFHGRRLRLHIKLCHGGVSKSYVSRVL